MKRLNVFATFLFMFLVLAAPGFSQGSSDRDYWGSGWGYGHMMFGGLPMIVFWGVVVLLVVLLARWFAQGNNTSVKHEPRQTPLEILQERFVRGEIDKSEYEERKKTLQQ